MTIQFVRRFVTSRVIAPLFAALVIGPAWADVELRVEARPISDPIQVFVTVTDNGDPVSGLDSTAFTVTLDDDLLTIAPGDLTPPPSEGSQKVSVVFVMDYSESVTDEALPAMQAAVNAYIDAMALGDYAAIIKFNADSGASVVAPFTEIDQGPANDALKAAVLGLYPGDGTNLLDAVILAVDQFAPPSSLPVGPKAIVVVTDGGDNESTATESEVFANANANSIPIFAIGVGQFTLPGRSELLTELGTQTGGDFIPAPTPDDIAAAYVTVSQLLNNEYLLLIPSPISDCDVHTMEVTVAGETASVEFTRRICDTEPDPFTFTIQNDVARGVAVTSNTVPITGLEIPADISTQVGSYSIGCNGTFTGDPGTISNGQTVCVRHTASSASSTSRTTTLTIGGVAGTFTSTTAAAPPEGGGGGGGATGGIELLLGFIALIARRRRRV